IGFLIASMLKGLVLSIFRRTELDERIGKNMKVNFRIDRFVAKLVYYLVLLYVLLLVLDTLGIENVLEPLQNMVNEFLGFLPNVIGAGIIGFAGYVMATIISEAVGLLAGSLEKVSEKIGWKGSVSLTKIAKQLIFIFVFLPILVVALDTLKMEAISRPLINMLNTLLAAIPNIIAAAIILTLFFIGGQYLVKIITDLMKNLGVDTLAPKMGISSMIGEETSLSQLFGNIAFFFLMFAGIISATEKLEMAAISNILNDIFHLSGKIFLGMIIMAFGSFIANKAADTLARSEDNAWLSALARFAILGIFIAIALSTMGIGQNIVNLAFGLTLGALAVAFALSFGLGGRAAAGKHMEHLLSKFRGEQKN
ncbi:MAG: mechanosensitive ion channel, partial [Bacteroidota bacterium]